MWKASSCLLCENIYEMQRTSWQVYAGLLPLCSWFITDGNWQKFWVDSLVFWVNGTHYKNHAKSACRQPNFSVSSLPDDAEWLLFCFFLISIKSLCRSVRFNTYHKYKHCNNINCDRVRYALYVLFTLWSLPCLYLINVV